MVNGGLGTKVLSDQLVSDLFKFGILPRKTYLNIKFPLIPKEYQIDYIRGFFDGDGWISCYDRRPQDRCKNKKWEVGFGSSYEMIDFISKHFSNVLNIQYKEPKKNCIYRIRYSSKENIAKIMDYLYKDSTVYLDRKHTKMLLS